MPNPNFVDKTICIGDNLDILRGMNSECVAADKNNMVFPF